MRIAVPNRVTWILISVDIPAVSRSFVQNSQISYSIVVKFFTTWPCNLWLYQIHHILYR